jgi:FtsP/CotA-like multicopper oxidase with cupredoxin domain
LHFKNLNQFNKFQLGSFFALYLGTSCVKMTLSKPAETGGRSMGKTKFLVLIGLTLAVFAFPWSVDQGRAQLATPDYFGVPNYANSPLPQIDVSGAVIPGTGMRKFVDTLPGLCALGVNNLGQCLPLAMPDTGTYPFLGPAADFYRIGLKEYTVQMHSDLPPTNLRGYVQIDSSGNPVYDPATPGKQQYLGPLILTTRNRPVRILFNNQITTDLNIPVDTTYMGAGMVNDGLNSMMASQKRATLHLHGGNTPWISDGTPHQWVTPAGGDGQPNALGFAKGFSFMNVPDMIGPSLVPVPDVITDGLGTFYWPNQQSGRLLFFHDHAYGITRLNVYAGEAAGYLLVDPAQEDALAAATVPGTIGTTPDLAHVIPLVIQDKTFVPDPAQLTATDPTWDTVAYGGKGNLWFPHVYMPNQDPFDETGANPFGRWDWGPWFWPPQPVTFGGVPCTSIAYPGVQLTCPSTPNPSGTPEAFMDTPVVNGTAYPKLVVDPRAYRFHILSVGNDRALNLGLYVADPLSVSVTAGGSGYTTPPAVTITGGGGTYTSATATIIDGAVVGITVTGATGYTTTPTVTITGGGGTGAAAIASVNTEVKMVPAVPANVRGQIFTGRISSLTLTSGGSGYRSIPTVTIAGGGGGGATATATIGKHIAGIRVTNRGSGYTSKPTVTITGGGGSGATATATIQGGKVWSIHMTNRGSGYTSPPTVTITGGSGSGATAAAKLSAGGSVASLWLTSVGSGYISPPTVMIKGGGGRGAKAIATLSSSAGDLPDCTTSNQMSGGGLALAQDTSGNPINTPTGLPAGCWPTYNSTFFGPLSWPTDSRDGGVPDPTTAGPAIIQIGTEGGLLPNVAVIPSTPVSYDYNKRSVTVLNVLNHGLFLGPAERADVIIDFSAFAGKTLILYNDAPAPVPAADPRVDYYTDNPDFTPMGGAPSTLAGYGPNTRTIIQIVVNNTTPNTSFNLATLKADLPTIFASTQDPIIVPETAYPAANGGEATDTYARIQDTSLSFFSGGPIGGLTLINGGSGYTSTPTVTITGGGGSGATATATLSGTGSVVSLTLTNGGNGYTSTPTVTIAGGGGTGALAAATGPVAQLLPKTIQELFTLDYGRMNALLGVEMPFTNNLIQTTIPYGYIDPPTEVFKDGDTQLWKITHNGVDTHFIHFHLFTVQVINRVGWDGAIKPPDLNELSFKDTVRMNPLEDIVVALRPMSQNLPWDLPNSSRPMDVTMPLGTTAQFLGVDPINQPAVVTNSLVNFGWEYVWHCHILGHEENDMMRAMSMSVAPNAPSNLSANPLGPTRVDLTWQDNSINETGFTVQRATTSAGPWTTLAIVPANAGTYSDTTVASATTYYYQVIANNLVGYTQPYAPPAIGYPQVSADSAPAGPVSVTTP